MNRGKNPRTLAQESPAAVQEQAELCALNNLKDQIIQATLVFMVDKTKKTEYLQNLVTIRTKIDALCEGRLDASCC